MRKNAFLLLSLMVLLLMGCSPSEAAIQTAISGTETAKPTATNTVIPTDTPTVTPSLTPTETPTFTPSLTPSYTPTKTPTETPTPLPLEERILGKWQGGFVNKNGDKVPAIWTLYNDGTMVIEITLFPMSYGGKWWVENNRLYFTTEISPDEENYRDIEFPDDDVMRTIKNDIIETWTRVKE